MLRLIKPLKLKSDLIITSADYQVYYRELARPMNWSFVENIDFIYVIEGSLSVDLQKEVIDINSGQLVLLTKNSFYKVKNKNFNRVKYIHISFSIQAQKFNSLNSMQAFEIDCDLLKGYISKSCLTILNEINNNELTHNNLKLMFTEIYKRTNDFINKDYLCMYPLINKSKGNELTQNVLNHFQKNMNSTNILKKVSLNIDFSREHISRVFKNKISLTPLKCFQIMKIKRSQFLLPIKSKVCEITFLLGFADQSHFNKTFKKILGMTPTEYKGPKKFDNQI